MKTEHALFIMRWGSIGLFLIFVMMFVCFPVGVGLVFGLEWIADLLEHRP